MIIKRVKLDNFRSHGQYVLDCTDNTSLILGPNGCGKTSVLEGIYEATRGKSFRATDSDIVKRGEGLYRVEIEYVDGEKVVAIYESETKKKTFLAGGSKTTRLSKKAQYPAVLFLPDDLRLISASPTTRREYFDKVLSLIDNQYSSILHRYTKALRQKNEILKEGFVTPEMVYSWDVILAQHGIEIRRRRMWLKNEINKQLTTAYRSIAENEDEAGIIYNLCPVNGGGYSGWGMVDMEQLLDGGTEELGDIEEYLAILRRDLKRDSLLGHTSYGVHRDNYEFVFNRVGASGSASRGEVRSIILALKFIEADLILKQVRKRPIILLDDVFSELDAKRQECLVTNFKDNQVFITSTERNF